MFLLIWALNKDVPMHKDNFVQLYDTLPIALEAAHCQIEDSTFEDVVFTPVTDFKFGYHEVIQAWQSEHGELLLIIKMEIKNDI
tara:strand:+ start:856 stop:1107 length:252 start_codon:yes stop_codon:yes gene_type:complete